ncbi:hypothetical protein [Microbacterium aurum]
MDAHKSPEVKPMISRRTLLTSGAAAAVGVASGAFGGAAGAFAAADYSKVPKLPGEIGRMDTQRTPAGNAYQVVDVSISGDRTRLFIPNSAPPNKWAWTPVIWFYHANGSSYASLSTAFKYGAEPAIDYGAVSVCPNYGGSDAWVSPAAVAAQTNAVDYMNSLWRIYYSFARANSGGGALMCWAFGNKMLPRQQGMYLASGVYDMADVYARGPERVGPAYGYDNAKVQATNPATLPQSAWQGARIRASYNPDDQTVPPQQHAIALETLAGPVAIETSYRTHDGGGTATGHTVPGWVNTDMLATFQRWAGL